MYEPQVPLRQRPPIDPALAYSHSRTRTTSSNALPVPPQPQAPAPPVPIQFAQQQQPQQQYQQQQYQQHQYQQQVLGLGLNHSRRSPSVNTFSTVSSSGGGGGGMAPPAAYRTSPISNDIVRRSTSSGGNASINTPSSASSPRVSYVALLRRQKATVWCERAQFEDPRLAAQQRAAKVRANREIGSAGGASFLSTSGAGRTSTGLSSAGGKVAAKIRHHHGSKTNMAYGGSDNSNYVGIAGVPVRLSATEVEGEDSDDYEDYSASTMVAMGRSNPHHRRTGSSGRSSTASGRRGPPQQSRTSSGALVLPPSSSGGGASSATTGARRYSPNDTPERSGSLVENNTVLDDTASGKARSTASGSSAERADQVPDLGNAGRLPPNSTINASLTREKSVRTAEDLRRRGSVDERTMTLSTGRLFIANPD